MFPARPLTVMGAMGCIPAWEGTATLEASYPSRSALVTLANGWPPCVDWRRELGCGLGAGPLTMAWLDALGRAEAPWDLRAFLLVSQTLLYLVITYSGEGWLPARKRSALLSLVRVGCRETSAAAAAFASHPFPLLRTIQS